VDVRYDAGKEIGVMLDRKLFDQDLANQAVAAGAELQVEARVSGITSVKDGIRTLTIEQNGNVFAIEAAMVVGADGAESLSGRWVGLKTRQLPPVTCTAIELRIKAMDRNPNHLTFWQGHDSINRGYIWVFPKVKSQVVNLGSGVITPKLGEKNMYDLSMEYKQRLFPDAEIEEVHGGAVPVSGNLEEYVDDRFLLSGDAAHHTNPLTGGGIMASIVAAEAAANWIDAGFRAGNLSKVFLKQYEGECWDRFGRNHRKEARIRDFVLGLPVSQQAGFYRAFRGMVRGGFSLPSKAFGFTRLGLIAARNPGLTKKVFFS
jgi:digeranylgeranylglycerophospholipid reductase